MPSVRQREGHPVARMATPGVINAEARGYGKACERCSLPSIWSAPALPGWGRHATDELM